MINMRKEQSSAFWNFIKNFLTSSWLSCQEVDKKTKLEEMKANPAYQHIKVMGAGEKNHRGRRGAVVDIWDHTVKYTGQILRSHGNCEVYGTES